MSLTANTDPAELLGDFGLGRQEAAVYVELLAQGELNGYEVAKALGISRSNAYTALAGLADKGAARISEGPTTRYSAVPGPEFVAARLARLRASGERLLAVLPERRQPTGGYLTVRGAENILDRLQHLLTTVRQRVYVALPGKILATCVPTLHDCLKAGRKVVIVTDAKGAQDRAVRELDGAIVYVGRVPANSVRAIVDSHHVLTGDVRGGKDATCLDSDNKNLVDLFKSALRYEIRLIELGAVVPEE
jgi:sugar-specific transcriptional regulator TrmB